MQCNLNHVEICTEKRLVISGCGNLSSYIHMPIFKPIEFLCFSTLSSILWERNRSKVTMLMWRICLKLHIPGSVCGEWAYSSTTVKNVMFNGAPEARYILRRFWIRNGFALYRFNTRWAYCLLIFWNWWSMYGIYTIL